MFQHIIQMILNKIIFKCVDVSAKKQQIYDAEFYDGKVKMPKSYFIFAVVIMIFFIVLSIFLYNVDSTAKLSEMIFLSAFSLLGLPIVLGYINWNLEYDIEKIIVKNLIGITHEYYIHDVNEAVNFGQYLKVRTSSGNFLVYTDFIGFDNFIKFLESRNIDIKW